MSKRTKTNSNPPKSVKPVSKLNYTINPFTGKVVIGTHRPRKTRIPLSSEQKEKYINNEQDFYRSLTQVFVSNSN